METNYASLLPAQGPSAAPPLLHPLSRSVSLPIRAPLSFEDNATDDEGAVSASDAGSYFSGDEGFGSSPERLGISSEGGLGLGAGGSGGGGGGFPVAGFVPRARVSWEDEDLGEVFDEEPVGVVGDDEDDGGFAGVARVSSSAGEDGADGRVLDGGDKGSVSGVDAVEGRGKGTDAAEADQKGRTFGPEEEELAEEETGVLSSEAEEAMEEPAAYGVLSSGEEDVVGNGSSGGVSVAVSEVDANLLESAPAGGASAIACAGSAESDGAVEDTEKGGLVREETDDSKLTETASNVTEDAVEQLVQLDGETDDSEEVPVASDVNRGLGPIMSEEPEVPAREEADDSTTDTESYAAETKSTLSIDEATNNQNLVRAIHPTVYEAREADPADASEDSSGETTEVNAFGEVRVSVDSEVPLHFSSGVSNLSSSEVVDDITYLENEWDRLITELEQVLLGDELNSRIEVALDDNDGDEWGSLKESDSSATAGEKLESSTHPVDNANVRANSISCEEAKADADGSQEEVHEKNLYLNKEGGQLGEDDFIIYHNKKGGGQLGEDDFLSGGPEKVAILESPLTADELANDLQDGSSVTSSGVGISQVFSHQGRTVSDCDEVDADEEGDGKELVSYAALASLLRAAYSASLDDNIFMSPSDAARISSANQPAGFGYSLSLKPTPSLLAQSNELPLPDIDYVEEDENMDEDEKKLHEKVEQIKVKFLRLLLRLGRSPDDPVAARVLYRLGLAKGIKHMWKRNHAFSYESANRKALQLEEDGDADPEFSCRILILGKSGVGKSATINSIFGKETSVTDAFAPATKHVKDIDGVVDGVRIQLLDTPGFRPSGKDNAWNMKILSSIKRHIKKSPPDVVLYVDRFDTKTLTFNDLPLLSLITSMLGSSIWFNAVIALTHAASAPPDGPTGTPLSYGSFVAERYHAVHRSIQLAARDMRVMCPLALVENHPSCEKDRNGQRVLPNGTVWINQLLLHCYSSKITSEANSLTKPQEPPMGKLFGFHIRSPLLSYLLSKVLQSNPHPKLASDEGIDSADSDIDLDVLDSEAGWEEDEYDLLPPFKPLDKSQIAMLSNDQKNAYFDEYEYRVKLLQKKQWKEAVRRMKEMKEAEKATAQHNSDYGDRINDHHDMESAPAYCPIPLPDNVLPPTFDSDDPTYRYRSLEPTSNILMGPLVDKNGWDHDYCYYGFLVEKNLAIVGRFPAGVAAQVRKDKEVFWICLDSSVCAKLGKNGSALIGFNVKHVGEQLSYILRSEGQFKISKKNKTTAAISMMFLGENVCTGLNVENQILIRKRVSLETCAGVVFAQGDTAYGVNFVTQIRNKDYPVERDASTIGFSLKKIHGESGDMVCGVNAFVPFSVGRNSRMAVQLGLNNDHTGQIAARSSSSNQLQFILCIIRVALSICTRIWPRKPHLVQ